MSAAGAVSVLGARTVTRRRAAAGDHHDPLGLFGRNSACVTPQTIVAALLRAEGFTDVRLHAAGQHNDSVARGELDFDSENAPWLVLQVDAGEPITVSAGMHVGCYELSCTSRSEP